MFRSSSTFVFFLAACLSAAAATAGSESTLESAAKREARAATPVEIGLLNEVLHKTANDYRRWAFTEHRVMRDDKGKIKSDLLLRFDPSKPYPEQWTPITINGKPPTERDRTKYRRLGEKEAPPDITRLTKPSSDPRHRSLGELIDLPRSSIAAESATHFIFDVALVKIGNERFPPEKFQVLARVKKEGAALENISVRLRESFRSKLVLKVKSGEASLNFEPVNPKYPPALVELTGDAVASILFVNVGGALVSNRTELKHVKPYDERFDVQIGTLKAIDF